MQPLAWHRREFDHLIALGPALPHALLVRGPRGVGKLVFARALGEVLLCEARVNGRACGSCVACTWFAAGTHPDFRQIEPGSETAAPEEGEKKSASISVDQIRELPDFINISSHRGGPKVVVIQPAEALNVNAANALLKSLEEPPAGTYFVLVTHRPHQLLPTIRSRCQQIALALPDRAAARAWLADKGLRQPDVALSHFSDAPLLAHALEETEYWGARAAFMRHLTASDVDVLAAGEAVRDFQIPYVIAWLQKWSYDLVHSRFVGGVRYNPDYAEIAARLAPRLDAIELTRFHRDMIGLQRVAQHPLNPRLFIEDALLGYRDLVRSGHVGTVP
jgi:DNA polymerase III subunit delta'